MKTIYIIFLLMPLFCKSQIISTIAGTGVSGYFGDGSSATLAKFSSPTFVKIDDSGYIFVSDHGNNVIRKISPIGNISTFAGNGISGYGGDGGQATNALLNSPAGVAFDHIGNVYIADWGNNVIRKVNTMGVISTIAGNNTSGYDGDGGQATNAKLNLPTNITFDTIWNLFIADHANNVIRKVDLTGTISTFAGTGTRGYFGDGLPATVAQFWFPFDISFDHSGNFYIADAGNLVIRKINTSGIISTFAGNAIAGFTGDGIPATSSALWSPTSLAIDGSNNIYIADFDNYRIRKVNVSGIITTVAGTGVSGLIGDMIPATSAELDGPEGVALDRCGNLFIADAYANKIRKVTFDTSCTFATLGLTTKKAIKELSLYPNPTTTNLSISNNGSIINSVTIYNLIGQLLYNNEYNNTKVELYVGDLAKGIYIIKVNGYIIQKFIKE